jgi:hypothetical protein
MVNIDNYNYPDLKLRLVATNTYRVDREVPLDDLVKEIVVTSDSGREIVCMPEGAFGAFYEEHLREMSRRLLLEGSTSEILVKATGERTTIIDLLTGSADYDLERLLPELNQNLNGRSVVKIGSKRERVRGEWLTRDGTIKGELGVGSPQVLLSADITATGSTEERMLATPLVLSLLNPDFYEAINDQCGFYSEGQTQRRILMEGLINATPERLESYLPKIREVLAAAPVESIQPISDFLIIVNGTDLAGKVADKFAPLYKVIHPEFRGFNILYSEGIFELATKQTELVVKTPGTDILTRNGASLELVMQMLAHPESFLNTCAIYYGSKRARGVEAHAFEVIESLVALYAAAKKGFTKEEHLQQRMPAFAPSPGKSWENFNAEARRFYTANENMEEHLGERISTAYQIYGLFWQSEFVKETLEESVVKRLNKVVDAFSSYGSEYLAARLADKYGVNPPLSCSVTEIDPVKKNKLDKLLDGTKRKNLLHL